MINIRGVDHAASRTHCWRVTVQRRTRVYVRHFSDGRHGGTRNALQAAKTYRDVLIAQHSPLTAREFCAIRKKTTRSGTPGVVRVEGWEQRRGRRLRRVYWDAQWPVGKGKARHKKFSVKLYGERGAYLRALRARRQALKALGQRPFRIASTSA